jgi:hypothetical protein
VYVYILRLYRVSSKQSNLFSVRTETNRNSICFGCFSVCFEKPNKFFFGLFRFVPVFRSGIETTETNRNKPKTSPKNKSLLGYPRNNYFFLVRTETNRNSTCFGCFSVCFFRETKQNFFRFVSVFRTGIETTETNRTNCMEN